MVSYKAHHVYNTNILDVKNGIIVHGCNAQGVMGSGVAKQLRDKYPGIYNVYVKKLTLGSISIYKQGDLSIVNMITQQYYGRDKGTVYISYDALRSCLEKVNNTVPAGVSLYVPYLVGAGLANGDEATILNIFNSTITDRNIYYCHLGGRNLHLP